MLRPYLQKKRTRLSTPISVEAQAGSFLYYIINEGRYRKTANAFGISRAPISGIIKKSILCCHNNCRPKTNKVLPTTE